MNSFEVNDKLDEYIKTYPHLINISPKDHDTIKKRKIEFGFYKKVELYFLDR